MASLAGTPTTREQAALRLAGRGAIESILADDGPRQLEQIHMHLVGRALDDVLPTLERAYRDAAAVYRAGGANAAADGYAACCYAADVLVELAANGALDAVDTNIAIQALAQARDEPLAAAAVALFMRTVYSPALLELPPPVTAGIVCRLLLFVGVTVEVSIWQIGPEGALECVLYLGDELPSRRARALAKSIIRGKARSLVLTGHNLRAAPIRRFGTTHGAVVAAAGDDGETLAGYLAQAAAALAPVLERAHLQQRGAARERALVAAAERRLTHAGFDLHDGPIQDVIALGGEIAQLRDELYPFVLESHRDLAHGRFDDLVSRAHELDRYLREMAHSLESRSIVSRPVGEVLHRLVDSFQERSGITTELEVKGDPETLGSGQRIAVFRAVQESLSNIKEHSGASRVSISMHARRHVYQLVIVDDGHGFDVPRALARAAQNGRLGLVGIAERVRMLGGTFDLDSHPGGPTRLTLTLPRAEQLTT